MNTLFDMTDDQVLVEAARIVSERRGQAQRFQAQEVQRLYKKYATHRTRLNPAPKTESDPPEDKLGKPLRLEPMEALLLVALERNKFIVEAHEGGRWFGSAHCKYNLRGGAMGSGTSRLDLLMGLWQIASDQEGGAVTLTEEHLNGSVVQAHLRQLNAEVRAQDKHEKARRWAWGCTQ
jgi:hypothetical protein